MFNKMTKDEIKNKFDQAHSEKYVDGMPSWFPEVEYAFKLLVKTLNNYIVPDSQIADLGAGTGNLSKKVFESIKDIKITLVDFSDNMLSQVPIVLEKYKNNYDIVKGDIFSINFDNNKFDNIISSFAIHHGRGKKAYEKLYKNIYNWLKPGGIFICCDVVEGGNKYLTEINEYGWSSFLMNNGYSKEDVEKLFENYYKEDSPLPVYEHLDILKKSGFSTVDILWKKYNFAIYMGEKF